MTIPISIPWCVNYVPGSGGNFLAAILWQWHYLGADPIRSYVSRFGNLHRYRDWMLNWQSRDRGQLQRYFELKANREDLPLIAIGHLYEPQGRIGHPFAQFRVVVSPEDQLLMRIMTILKIAIDCHGLYPENHWEMMRRRFPTAEWAKLVTPDQLTDSQISEILQTYNAYIMPTNWRMYFPEYQPEVAEGCYRVDIPVRTLLFDEQGTMALLKEHLGTDPVSDEVSRSLDLYCDLNYRAVTTYYPGLI